MTEYKVGDKVRLTLKGGFDGIPERAVGVIAEIRDTTTASYSYPLRVNFDDNEDTIPLKFGEVELVRDAETQQLADQLSSKDTELEAVLTSSAVKSPSYYVLPNGHEVIEFSQWLNGNGAQAVQYIARATRIDGVIKDDPIQDIEKAILFLKAEKARLESINE